MDGARIATSERLNQLLLLEHLFSCAAARAVHSRSVLLAFRAASRLGDWALSAVVGVVVLLAAGPFALATWGGATVIGLTLQCQAKRRWARIRPCQRPDGPPQRAPIPDPGSFPSGHTLHSVLGAVVVAAHVPVLAPVFGAIAVLVATSRIVLGVHYPSDVVAGGTLGALLGIAANSILF